MIDFGDMVYSWTVADPAIAAAYALLDRPNPLETVAAIVRGYQRQYPLRDEELSAVFPLAALRLCMSACIAARQQQQRPDDEFTGGEPGTDPPHAAGARRGRSGRRGRRRSARTSMSRLSHGVIAPTETTTEARGHRDPKRTAAKTTTQRTSALPTDKAATRRRATVASCASVTLWFGSRSGGKIRSAAPHGVSMSRNILSRF